MEIQELRTKFYELRQNPDFKENYPDFFSDEKPFVVISESVPEYHEVYDRRDDLILQGDLVLGALIMANNKMFSKKSKFDCPGDFLYSYDTYYEDHPRELADLADSLYAIRELPESEIWFDYVKKEIYDILNAEETPYFNYKVPTALTNGRDVYLTTLIIKRKDLANRFLEGDLFPLIIKDDIHGGIILPYYISDLNAKIREKYKKKKILQIIAPIIALIALALTGFQRNGISTIIIFGVLILFTMINWRCPNCKRYLGKGSGPDYCPKCSVRLK